MGFDALIKAAKELGVPIVLILWFMYITTVIIMNGKENTKSIDRLNQALGELVKTTNVSFNNLIKQNNFMLHALSNLIMGHKKSAKEMMDQAIVDIKDIEDKDGDEKC